MNIKSVIYVLVHPVTKEVRYCGGTVQNIKNRLYVHLYDSKRNTHHCARWIQSLLKQGLRPEILVIQELSIKEFFLVEISWIYWFRRNGIRLTNSTIGGEGTLGYKYTDEHKKKLSEALKGKPKSEETKRKMSASLIGHTRNKGRVAWNKGNKGILSYNKGKPAWNKGIPMPDEVKKRISLSKIGMPSWNKGKPLTEEHKRNLSLARKKNRLCPAS